jgi:hypothetical protein
MEVVTDKNVLDSIKKLKLEKEYNIKEGDIVNDPKILDAIKLQKEKRLKKDETPNFFEKWVLGEGRTQYPDLPEIGQVGIKKADGSDADLKNILGSVALSITPSTEAQVDIIKKLAPGTIPSKDKFGNIILSFPKEAGGQTAYLNKPGFSATDISMIPQALTFIPGAGMVQRHVAGGLIKKSFAQGAAAGGTSLIQDVAATSIGSEQGFEGGKFAVSAVGGMVAEPIANFLGKFTVPVIKYAGKKLGQGVDKILPEGLAASQFNIFSGSGQFLNSKGIVTDKAKDIGRKVGVDTNLVDKKTLIEFAQALEDGVEPAIAKELVGANQFGISLWKAQALKDKSMLKQIQSMRDGAYGTEGIEIVAKQDEIQIKQSLNYLNNLRKKLLTNPEKNLSTQGTIGTNQASDESIVSLTTLIKELESKQQNIIASKYKAVDFDGVVKAPVMKNFTKNIKNALEDSESGIGAIPDANYAPGANKALLALDKFSKNFTRLGKNKKVKGMTIKVMESERKRINNFLSNTKDPTDRKALMVIKREYDKFFYETVEKGLATGDDGVLLALKSARSEYKKLDEMFNPQDILKKGGRIKDNGGAFMQNVIRGDYSPEKIANWIYGNGSLGKPYTNQSIQVIERIEKIFPKGSEGWDVLKDGAFLRLVNSSFVKSGSKEIFRPELFVKSVNESLNGKGRLISNAIYTDAEKKTLKEFSKQLAKTLTPKTLLNNSKTAATLVDLIGQSTIRSGAGVLAYNLGGIQTMLFTRFGFDNLAKASAESAARKILMDAVDINAIPSVTGFQGIINYGVENRPFIQKEKEYETSKEIFNLLNKK